MYTRLRVDTKQRSTWQRPQLGIPSSGATVLWEVFGILQSVINHKENVLFLLLQPEGKLTLFRPPRTHLRRRIDNTIIPYPSRRGRQACRPVWHSTKAIYMAYLQAPKAAQAELQQRSVLNGSFVRDELGPVLKWL